MFRPDSLRYAPSFDEIGILPSDNCEIRSRKEIDLSTNISRNVKINLPIIASPMDTVTDIEMCLAMNSIGACGILHRFMSIEEQIEKSLKIKKETGRSYVAVGLQDYQDRILNFLKLNVDDYPDLFFLDTANGSTVLVYEFAEWWKSEVKSHLKNLAPDLILGNTLTKSSVTRSFNLGADGVRHGIGIGSQCLTSTMTGIRCPAFTAIYYGWKGLKDYQSKLVDFKEQQTPPTVLLDGGIKKPEDLAKAIFAGADAVICGGIFAECKETPSEILYRYAGAFMNEGQVNDLLAIEYSNKADFVGDLILEKWILEKKEKLDKVKKIRGMASKGVVDDYGLWDGKQENLFIEGKETLVEYHGKTAKDVVYEYVNGLKSALSYTNFLSVKEAKGSIWDGRTIAIQIKGD